MAGKLHRFLFKVKPHALNLLRQRIQFFTMPLAQKEFETQLLKLLVLTICFFLNLRITAMTFCVAAENGDEFRFEVPYEDWFKEHEGQELTLYYNVDPDPEAAAGTSIASSLNIFRNLSKSALLRALSEDTLRCSPNLSEEMSEVL